MLDLDRRHAGPRPLGDVLNRVLNQLEATLMGETTIPTKSKRQREKDARVAEHHAVMAARRKWLEDHPDVASRPAGERPWGASQEAPRGVPWWGVKRMGPHGNANHRSMFRHGSRASADREAAFLAETFPSAVFVVLEAVSVHVTGIPEVTITAETGEVT